MSRGANKGNEMVLPFAAAFAMNTAPSLFGGALDILNSGRNKKAAWEQSELDRKRYKWDRDNERRYAGKITRQTDNRMRRFLEDDRRYAEDRLTEARGYSDRKLTEDYNRYRTDRTALQRVADNRAKATASSRGIDFAKLRDDAVAAGYNPLTALNMAHAYSTEVGYSPVGDVYGGGPAFFTPGGGAGGGGGGVPMSGGVAPGGGYTPGAGYQSSFQPSLSSGGFIAEALQRGADTWYNHEAGLDAEEQSVMGQVIRQRAAREALASTPRDFGYSLAKTQPYSPAVGVGNAPLDGNDTWHTGAAVNPAEVDPITTTTIFDTGNVRGEPRTVRGWNPDTESEIMNEINGMYVLGQTGLTYGMTGENPWWGTGDTSKYPDGKKIDLNKLASGIGGLIRNGARPFIPPINSEGSYDAEGFSRYGGF